jgi:pimeloyl-ACP methyl ester carboxylesterase
MHGDDSRLEEASDLIPKLLKAAAENGLTAAVITFDVPPFGYSRGCCQVEPISGVEQVIFDHGMLALPGWPSGYPALDFIESYIIAFVETLDRIIPCKDRIFPIGGSLGGNMALRLGRRYHRCRRREKSGPGLARLG